VGKQARQTAREDPLLAAIEQELMPGSFVRYGDMFDFVRDLEQVEEKLAALAKSGAAARAVDLYELFLAGAYDKIEECDDSGGGLGMFWAELLCGWIEARQAAKLSAGETVQRIIHWEKNDNYGFCYQIEQEVAKVLNREGYRLLVQHYEQLVDEGLGALQEPYPDVIFDYDSEVRFLALTLKGIYEVKGDTKSYAALCNRMGLSPKDCERLAEIETRKRRWEQALAWVEKGLELEPTRDWMNERSHSLAYRRPELLSKLGRKDESVSIIWAAFEAAPSVDEYERMMEYVPEVARAEWHKRAMEAAGKGELGDFMDICVATGEWNLLASRIHKATRANLEQISHHTLEPVAEGLAECDVPAAIKLYRALGFRVLISGKSRYYDAALTNFRRAKQLCEDNGLDAEWQEMVALIRANHSRKSAFMPSFEELISGAVESRLSFAEKARARWAKQSG
jgi:tetratricopeptide (TPR) repeat protein